MSFIPYPAENEPYEVLAYPANIVAPSGESFQAKRIALKIETPSHSGWRVVACQCAQHPEGVTSFIIDKGCPTRSPIERDPYFKRHYFIHQRYWVRTENHCGLACHGKTDHSSNGFGLNNIVDYAPLISAAMVELNMDSKLITFSKQNQKLGAIGRVLLDMGYDLNKTYKPKRTYAAALARGALAVFDLATG